MCYGSGRVGKGQTISLVFSLQNSQIFWCKYHCLSKVNPGGGIMSGRFDKDGLQVISFTA